MFFVANDKSLQLLLRKPRSKWYALACFGRKKHYRKDGSCTHTDAILLQIKPEAKVKVYPFGGKENARN